MNKNFKQVIYIYRSEFEECPFCRAYHENPDHQCKPRGDTKRIEGYWTVTEVSSPSNVDFSTYTLEKGDEVIENSVFSTQDLEFEIGDFIDLLGWQKEESRIIVLVAISVKPKFNNEIV